MQILRRVVGFVTRGSFVPASFILIVISPLAARADEQAAFWNPAREVASALELLQMRSVHPAWRAWWEHLEGNRLLAMARGQSAVDPGLLWKTCQRLEHPTARGEPDFYGLYEALLDWRVELELPRVQSLPESIRLAAAQGHSEVDNLRALIAATRLAAVRTGLSLHGPHAEAWRGYLQIPALSTLPDAPSEDTRAIVRETYRRTVTGHVGLDQRGVVGLRSALGRLLAGLEVLDAEPSSSEYRERMLALAAALETLDQGSDSAAEQTVSTTVSWLERSARYRPFAYAVRRRYTWPNIAVDVSADFVRRHSATSFERTERVSDQIQDISIRGDRTARGTVWIELVPHPTCLSFELLLQGDFVARTVGHAQRAQVFSDTTGEFSGRRRVVLDRLKFVGSPVSAIVRQSSRIRCISVDVIRLFQRIAMRRAWAEVSARRSAVEAISREHNENKVREAFERHSTDALEQARRGYVERVWSPLQRYGELPRLARIATTATGVEYRALVTDEGATGAFAPPPVATGREAVTVRFHASAIAHIAREVPQFGVMTALLDNNGNSVKVWAVAARTAPWLDATKEHQLCLVVGNSRVQVTFQLPNQPGQKLSAAATYDLRELANATADTKVDAVDVTLDGQPQPLLVSLIQQQLAQIRFASTEKTSPVRQPWWGRGAVTLTAAESNNGWLTLSWREISPPQSQGD